MIVPLTINFLNTENYGIWLTLSSFISWFSFFDVGLGNGLRNKFAEAKAKGDMTLAKGYVSSAYFTISAVSLGLIILFIVLNFFIDWTKVFNTSPSLQKDLILLMPIVFGFFCLQLVAKLITTIYTADQQHSTQGKVTFLTNAGSLLIVWLLTKTTNSSFLIFGIVYSVFPVLLLIGFNLVGFKRRYKQFKPERRFWNRDYLKDIFGLGFNFFLIQMAGIILFSTDNIIITQLFGPKKVVPYNISLKYFGIANMVLSLIISPYWSAITDAYVKKDLKWIKKSMNSLFKISIAVILLVLLMVYFSEDVYVIWVGDKVKIPFDLTIYMSIYIVLTISYSPFTFFINGTGKVKLQMYSILITSIINIPLSVYLALNLKMGVSGVIASTILCIIPHVFLVPIQYFKIINEKSKGIWDK